MLNALRRSAVHRSLHRPQQLQGGEREPMLFTYLLSVTLIVSTLNLVGITTGVVFYFICVFALRKMAKADPVMSKIYQRQVRYRRYYAAFSRPWRVGQSLRAY
jgi:type IV secretion system protein VirB3